LTPTATAAAAHCSLGSIQTAIHGKPIGEGMAYAISRAVRRPLTELLVNAVAEIVGGGVAARATA
jgi:hypothetical protein